MPMYMHTNCLLFASCNKLLNNSTFYHLKSLIALSIGMIRILRGCPLPIPLKFRPVLVLFPVLIVLRFMWQNLMNGCFVINGQ
jgi:hypothetical protein